VDGAAMDLEPLAEQKVNIICDGARSSPGATRMSQANEVATLGMRSLTILRQAPLIALNAKESGGKPLCSSRKRVPPS
jgi:hypothetical protein